MKAALLKKYQEFEWIDVPAPKITEQQVLLKTSYASICGTDQHIFKGEFHPRTPVPFIPGHEFAGKIVEIGSGITSFKEGDRVAIDPIIWCGKCAACKIGHYPACTELKLLGIDMDGGFAEYVAVNEDQIYPLNENISDQDAALIEVLSIGFHACNRSGLSKDDTAVIWGAGKIGHCILQAARTITQNTIFMVDHLASRLKIAADNYNDIVTIDIKESNPLDVIKDSTKGRGVDVAIEAVGHFKKFSAKADPVQGCIESIRGAGTVCVLGLSDDPAVINMKELLWREARIIASRVSHGEYTETIHHLTEGNLKPQIMVSEITPASQIQNAFQLLEERPADHLKILLNLTDTA